MPAKLSKRARILALILVNVICVVAIFVLLELNTPPEVRVINFLWSDQFDHIWVAGTIENSATAMINNVVLTVRIYTRISPSQHGQITLIQTNDLSLGSVEGKTSRSFNYSISYSPSGWAHVVDYTLTWSP
jgi:hypothetical protein